MTTYNIADADGIDWRGSFERQKSRAEKAEQERNREALVDHIAAQDRILRRRNEQIARQAKQIENQLHNAREAQRAIEEQEARGNAIAVDLAAAVTRAEKVEDTLLMVQQQRDHLRATLTTTARQRDEADDDPLTIARAQRDEARRERDVLRQERDEARHERDSWRAQVPLADWEMELIRATENPRPLTADDYRRGEMAALAAFVGTELSVPINALVRAIVTEVLTPPPSRPEGAEEIEAILAELPDTDLPITDAGRADLLAERGLRVTGGQS